MGLTSTVVSFRPTIINIHVYDCSHKTVLSLHNSISECFLYFFLVSVLSFQPFRAVVIIEGILKDYTLILSYASHLQGETNNCVTTRHIFNIVIK